MFGVAIMTASSGSAFWTIRQGAGYLVGEEEYVYGFPLVMMDVTRELVTAVSKAREYAAPSNQFGRIRTYVNPDFKNVVRISVNSLWSHGFLDLSTVNGWVNMTNLGRYGTDYNTRAFIAYAGLGALTSDDAAYPSAFIDGDGHALDAAYNCVIHFPKGQLPPSGSNVCSISPYRENLYIRSVLNRYGILSSMPLKYNADSSLDIFVQAKSPGPDKESNWLPTPPSGPFNLTTRIYEPKQDMLDGTYKLPPVTKVQ
jgi:hypothetical protein